MLVYVAATCVLWALSGALAVGTGLFLAAWSVSSRLAWRAVSGTVTTLTRGVPTSLLVVAAGITSIRIPPQGWLPDPFPGTAAGSLPVAWAVLIALALGSTGHLAVIFRTAYIGLGRARVDQSAVLGLQASRRLALLAREAAATAMPPTGARLVHHLHNTAFAALFPVADLFGWIENNANATFDVVRYAAAGAGVYVVLSGLIWAAFKALAFMLARSPSPALASSRAPVPATGGPR
jgi:ABC-type amino acid transport system permease subunit